MIETPWYKKLYAALGAIIAVLAGLFLYERKRADRAEAEGLSAEVKGKDAILAENQGIIDERIAEERAKLKATPEPEVDDFDSAEVKDYWKDKK